MKENKKFVLILEGVDLSGKSTLFDALIKEFPGIGLKITDRPINDSKVERSKIKGYYSSVLGFINVNYQSKNFILDRFFPSEIVYSKVKRGYEGFKDKELRNLERVIKPRNHLLIYCDPGVDTLVERYKSRGDEYINTTDLVELCNRYEEFLSGTSLRYTRLDTKKPVEQLIEELKAIVGAEEVQIKQRSLFE